MAAGTTADLSCGSWATGQMQPCWRNHSKQTAVLGAPFLAYPLTSRQHLTLPKARSQLTQESRNHRWQAGVSPTATRCRARDRKWIWGHNKIVFSLTILWLLKAKEINLSDTKSLAYWIMGKIRFWRLQQPKKFCLTRYLLTQYHWLTVSSVTIVLQEKALSNGTIANRSSGLVPFPWFSWRHFSIFSYLHRNYYTAFHELSWGKIAVGWVHSWQTAFVTRLPELWGMGRKCNMNMWRHISWKILGSNWSKNTFLLYFSSLF